MLFTCFIIFSGQEVGFNIHSLPAVTKTAGLLSENKLLLNSPSIHDRLNDVIDLESDEIENDDWDHNLLLDEVIDLSLKNIYYFRRQC